MLTVQPTLKNLVKARRLAVKHGLKYDVEIDMMLDSIPKVTTLPNFNYKLKDFQAEGVAWLEKHNGMGILADEQGTGKTVTVTAYAVKNKKFPMLVVCPKTLKFNWRNEVLAMTGRTYKINVVGHSYSKKQTELRLLKDPNVIYSKVATPGCDIYITNYDALTANLEIFEQIGLKLMAVDESHKCKNQKAKRTEAMQRLARGWYDVKLKNGNVERKVVGIGVESVILMSGTPLVNRPIELWTSVNTVASWVPNFATFKKFAFRYCNPQHNRFGWDFSGNSNAAELNEILTAHCMLRRLKEDVLKELPPKIYKTIPLDFDRGDYDKLVSAFGGIDWKKGIQTLIKFGGNPPKSDAEIVAIQKLREMAAYSKMASAVEWIKDYTDEGEKLVVFAHNRHVIEYVRDELAKDDNYKNAVKFIYGGVSDEERNSAVEAFQNNPAVKVIVIGVTTGSVGLTLTASSAVAFLQLPWTPGEMQQAADRIHRIGQVADVVTIYNLIAEGTIEEEIADMIFGKGMVMDAVLDNGRVVNAIDLRSAK